MVCPTQLLLAKDRYPPIATWPHELKSLSYLFCGNISETDLNTLDKHADILLCNFDTHKHGKCLLTKMVFWQLKLFPSVGNKRFVSKLKHGIIHEHKHKLAMGEKAMLHSQFTQQHKQPILHLPRMGEIFSLLRLNNK